MSTKWTGGGKGLHAGGLQVGEWRAAFRALRNNPFRPPPSIGLPRLGGWVKGRERAAAVRGLRPESGAGLPRAGASQTRTVSRTHPGPRPGAGHCPPHPKLQPPRHRASPKDSPSTLVFLQSHPNPSGQGSLTSRHFSTSPQLRAGENLKVTPPFGRRIRVPRPRSRARLRVRARSPHLAAAHDVGVLRQQIHHLAFAFVAPLRAQHHRHPVPAGPRPGAAAIAVGQGGCRRVGLGERHGSGDARRARKRRGRRGVREPNCSAAASHMRRKKEPEAGPAPAPAGPPLSSQAPPRSPPQPTQGATMTAPRRPAAAAPPAGRGPGGGNRRHPGLRPRPFRSLARHPRGSPRAEGGGGGASSALRLIAPPIRPGPAFQTGEARRCVLERRTTTPGMQRSGRRRRFLGPWCSAVCKRSSSNCFLMTCLYSATR